MTHPCRRGTGVMLTTAIRSMFSVNLGVKPEETVLVFTDLSLPDEGLEAAELCRRQRLRDIALLTSEIGKAFARRVTYIEYDAVGSHGAEPPPELWRAAFGGSAVRALERAGIFDPLLAKRASDEDLRHAEEIVRGHSRSAVAVAIGLSNFSTSHTQFRGLLTDVCGCRFASMPLFDASMLETSMNIRWRALARRTKAVARLVNRAVSVEIGTPNGTRVTLSKLGRKAIPDTGILTRRGAFGNLPAGEVFLAPVEGTAEGRLVLQWAPTRELASPVTLVVRNGMVREVIGTEPFADVLRKKLDERPENRNIAEFGIGTNDMARRPDNILESEKILGTIHIALGDNSSFGGVVKAAFHQDFVFFKPTVVLVTKGQERIRLLTNGMMTVVKGA